MTIESVHYFNLVLGAGAILAQMFALAALLLLFFGPKKNPYLSFIDKHFLPLGLFFALTGTIFSLIYSEVVGFAACYLCWWARIFLYPQLVLFGVAIWDRKGNKVDGDRSVIKYLTPLSALGFMVVAYHNVKYYFSEAGSTLPCDASGVSCYMQYVNEFGGYVSIPMLALTSFFCIFTVIIVAHFYGRKN